MVKNLYTPLITSYKLCIIKKLVIEYEEKLKNI